MLAASYAGKKPLERASSKCGAMRTTPPSPISTSRLEELLGALEQRGDLDRTDRRRHVRPWRSVRRERRHRPRRRSASARALEVPLLVSYPPKVPRGRRVNTAVSLRDLVGHHAVTRRNHASIPSPAARCERFWGDSPLRPGRPAETPLVMELSYNSRAAEEHAGSERRDGFHRARPSPPDPQRRWLDGVVRFPG